MNLNLKSVNSKFRIFLPIHCTVEWLGKRVNWGEVYLINSWIRTFLEIDTKLWICEDSELGGRELGGNTVLNFFECWEIELWIAIENRAFCIVVWTIDSFFWDQGQDINLSYFPAKNQTSDWLPLLVYQLKSLIFVLTPDLRKNCL